MWANHHWTRKLVTLIDYGNDAVKNVLIKVVNAHVMCPTGKGVSMQVLVERKEILVTVTEGMNPGTQSYNLGRLLEG